MTLPPPSTPASPPASTSASIPAAASPGTPPGSAAEQRARRVADAMWAAEPAMKWLGFSLDAVAPGRAEMSMKVEPHHLNANGICHGGFVFTLADSAFGYACNSGNVRTVAAHNAITFTAPARPGDRLRAVAAEVVSSGRSGVYDITVTNQDGAVIALMRGNARQIGGAHIEETTHG